MTKVETPLEGSLAYGNFVRICTPTIEEIAAQVQELMRASGVRKEVHMVSEPEIGYYQEPSGNYIESAEEVSYVNGQEYRMTRGFNQGYRSHPNLSYRSTNVANPQDQIYPPTTQPQQQPAKQYVPSQSYLGQQNQSYQNQQGQGYQNNYGAQYEPRPFSSQGQSNQQSYAPRAPQQMQNASPPTQQPRTTLEDIKALFFNGQMEITKAMNEVKGEIRDTRTELQGRLDALETRVKMVETQAARNAESIKRQQGFLPEVCVENEDMSLSETCHDPPSVKTGDISSMENQTRHEFCAEDILEYAAMPRTGPDKSDDHTVSQFDRVVHHDIGDSFANSWSMLKKGNGFPWDDGIPRELKLPNDPGLNGGNFRVSNLLQPPLILDQNKSGFLLKNRGTSAGIPRTGPDIPSSHEFDQSQFLRFAGEGGCITYCDVIGSVTRPPEVLLNVPVLC